MTDAPLDLVVRLRRDFGPWNDQGFEFASLGLEAASAVEDLRAEAEAARIRHIEADALLREAIRQLDCGCAHYDIRSAIAAYLRATPVPS